MRELPSALRGYLQALYAGCLVLIGAQLWLLVTQQWPLSIASSVAIFTLLTYAGERTRLQVSGSSSQTLATTVHIAVILLFPPPFPVLIALLGALFSRIVHERAPFYKRLFNTCHPTLAVGISMLVFSLVSTPATVLRPGHVITAIPTLTLLIGTYYLVDVSTILIVFTLIQKQLPWQIWWQVHRRTLFPELALATIGILAAVCWKFDGILLPLFAVPVVVLGAAFRAIAAEDRTRALRRRSEQLEAVLAAGQHLRLEHSQVELLRAVAEAARTIVKASAVGAYWPAQNDPATLERVVLLPDVPSLLSADEAGPTHLPLPAPGSGMQIVGADSSVPALLVPLVPDGGGMSGLLRVAGVPAELPDADRDTLAILATQATIALENTYLHQRALAQASTDGLTGLLNHRTFQVRLQEEVERAQRSGYSLALIMVDLDDFGSINNRYGHLAGDAALKAVATILNENTRNGDIAARYGGDEFAVILPEAAMDEALAIAERIHAEVATCRIAEGRILIRVNASLGVAALPDHATTREELVRVADQASYAAKYAGKGRVGRPEDALRLLDRDPEILAQQLANANVATVEALAAAVDARDPYTLGHAQRVSTYAQILAQAMDLPAADVKRVQMAGLLHDVGKIGIPDAILTKPESLTPDEFDIIKQHPVIGARMLTAVPFLRDILPAVRHHHERWDGLGYPDGLVGTDIPGDASIVMVADALDAMSTSRTYRLALSWPEVCRRIKDGSGAQFDPRVVRALERAISDGTLTAPLEEGSATRTEQLLRAG